MNSNFKRKGILIVSIILLFVFGGAFLVQNYDIFANALYNSKYIEKDTDKLMKVIAEKDYAGSSGYDALSDVNDDMQVNLKDLLDLEKLIYDEQAEILAAALSLEEGEELPEIVAFCGTIVEIPTPYSSVFDEITIDLDVHGTIIRCYDMSGGADLMVGDVITLSSYIGKHDGTLEFDTKYAKYLHGNRLDVVYNSLAIDKALSVREGEISTDVQTIKGTVESIIKSYSEADNNISLYLEVDGNYIYCDSLIGGKDLKVGDTIVVIGFIREKNWRHEFVENSTYYLTEPFDVPAHEEIEYSVFIPKMYEPKHEEVRWSYGFLDDYYYVHENCLDGPEEYYYVYDYSGEELFSFYGGSDGAPAPWMLCNLRTSDIAYVKSKSQDTYYSTAGAGGFTYDGNHIEVRDIKGNVLIDTLITPESAPAVIPDNWHYFTGTDEYYVLECTAIYGHILQLSTMDCCWERGDVWAYLDVDTGELYAPGTIDLPAISYPDTSYSVYDYDKSKWSCCSKTVFDDILFVETADTSEWGYLKNGELVAKFKDATGFSNSGYALVSYDCQTYYFMDSDFNVLKDYSFEGKSASLCSCHKTFVVRKADGSQYVIRME